LSAWPSRPNRSSAGICRRAQRKKSDSRAEGFEGESVELDAIPPPKLKDLARSIIEQHFNERQLKQTKKTERLEHETLRDFAEQLA
jgi:hypothetical protein